MASCTVDDCDSPPYRRGICNKHLHRIKKYGDPHGGQYFHGTPDERFWAKVDASGVCWEWTAFKDEDGYGMFSPVASKSIRAHRFAWISLVGPLEDELTIDHLCRNRACVNPDHLEPVPNVTNIFRGYGEAVKNASRDECIRGHLLSGPNLYVQPDGKRMCRTCKRARRRAYRARDKVLPVA